jgi:AcrR family transcriptional regulator
MKHRLVLPPRGDPAAQGTPERLIAAVERLLAEREDLDPPLRDITQAAGANVAAVNYHFGSKAALVTAVIERALAEHARGMLAAVDAVSNAQPPASVEQILWAWMQVFAGVQSNTLLGRIAARIATGPPAELGELVETATAEPRARLRELLADRLPQLSREELDFRTDMAALGLLMFTRGGLQQAPFDARHADISGDTTAHWALAFIVGGITAAPSGSHKQGQDAAE